MQKKQQSKKSSKRHASHERRTIVSYLKERKSITALLTGVVLVLTVTSVLYAQGVIHLPIVGKHDDANPSASQQERHVYLPIVVNDVGNDEWIPLESTELGIRISYPESWTILDSQNGEINLVANKDYYRSIGISEVDRSDVKTAWYKPFRTYVKQLLSAYGSKNATNATISSFEGKGVNGYIVTGFEIGVHSRVYFEHNDKVYVASLGQGGGIGGKSPYGWPHEEEDVALFYQILDTIEFLD